MDRLILASASPRRKEICEKLGLSFDVVPAAGEEPLDPARPLADAVLDVAKAKAREVSARYPGRLVLGADTVVAAPDGTVLGKPRDPADAARMLSLLSGRAHTVYTGVTVRRGTFSRTAHEATQVRFRPLTQSEISAYIATGEPMDKAGAYGIQGRGCVLVEGIDGNYHNVVGLPTCLLAGMLRQVGIDVLTGGQEGRP